MAVSRAEDRKKVVLAMDLCALLVVVQISREEGRPFEDVLPEFLCSDTGRLLYEEDTKFWWSAIPKIVEFYQGGKGA